MFRITTLPLLLAAAFSISGCSSKTPSGGEICRNGIDDDGNGKVDCGDSQCDEDAYCTAGSGCGNGRLDNDELCDVNIIMGDGACPTLDTCTVSQACMAHTLLGAACRVECGEVPITTAIDNDGCCPQGATGATDNDCEPCEHACPQVGATSCVGGEIRFCQDVGGCRQWSAWQSCLTGVCGDATTCDDCSHQCDMVGAQQCHDGDLSTCVADRLGCRSWGTPEPCEDGFCENNTTCGVCDHGCPADGELGCDGDNVRTCLTDGNGCRYWGASSSCVDSNECTLDTCETNVGCTHHVDGGLTPNDGFACTIDSCHTGTPTYTPDDSLCDDSEFCTGVETCAPGNMGADIRGCITTPLSPPTTPPGPCATWGDCDEGTQSFAVVYADLGTECDDRIACTITDVCDGNGACVGEPLPTCPTPVCGDVTHWDIPYGELTATVTLNGAPLPTINRCGSFTCTPYAARVYARAHDTGALHNIVEFGYNQSAADLWGPTVAPRVVPGIYDLLYARDWSPDTAFAGDAEDDDALPKGFRVLETGVVIGTGQNHLDIDIPTTRITASVTLDGGALPAQNLCGTWVCYPYGARFVAVSHDTGVRHDLVSFSYDQSTANLWGPYVTPHLIPGTYDIVYERNFYHSTQFVDDADQGDAFPSGAKTILSDVVVSGSSHHFDLDIPRTAVTANVTLAGAPLPATSICSSSNCYPYDMQIEAVAQSTGIRHALVNFGYTQSSAGLWGPQVVPYLPPDVYDLVFARYSYYSTRWVDQGHVDDAYPSAYRVLAKDIVVDGAAHHFDIDIPRTQLSATVTLNGAALPATNICGTSVCYPYGGRIEALAHDTGYRHEIINWTYDQSNATLYGPFVSGYVVPGTYDLIYVRNHNSDYHFVDNGDPGDPFPMGFRVLQTDVVISGASQHLDVDIPTTSLTADVTLNGSPLPDRNACGSFGFACSPTYARIEAVAHDTGYRHEIVTWSYDSSNGDRYPIVVSPVIIPGTYDLIYSRGYSYDVHWVDQPEADDSLPNGYQTLQRDVIISGASTHLALNIPTIILSAPITLNTAPLPLENRCGGFTCYPYNAYIEAISRNTSARHRIGSFGYAQSDADLWGPEIAPQLVTGDYDLLYGRDWSVDLDSGFIFVGHPEDEDLLPPGFRMLDVCIGEP